MSVERVKPVEDTLESLEPAKQLLDLITPFVCLMIFIPSAARDWI